MALFVLYTLCLSSFLIFTFLSLPKIDSLPIEIPGGIILPNETDQLRRCKGHNGLHDHRFIANDCRGLWESVSARLKALSSPIPNGFDDCNAGYYRDKVTGECNSCDNSILQMVDESKNPQDDKTPDIIQHSEQCWGSLLQFITRFERNVSSTTTAPDKDNKLSTGHIGGICAGVAAFVVLVASVAAIVIFIRCRKAKKYDGVANGNESISSATAMTGNTRVN